MKCRNCLSGLLFAFIVNGLSTPGFAQPQGPSAGLVPWEYVNETIRSVSRQVMGMEFSVNVNIVAPLSELGACHDDAFDGRLETEIRWYNPDDETGRMMLNMLKDMNGIDQEKESFKNESGFNPGDAREESFAGGTLWVVDKNTPCVNEITGPTGKTEYNTHARYFQFSGTTLIKIEVQGMNNPAKTKEIIMKMIELADGFDYAALKATVGQD